MIHLEFYDIFELLFLKLVLYLREKDVTEARSGEWRGWSTTTMWFAVKNHRTDKSLWASMLLQGLNVPVVWPFSACILYLLPCEVLCRTVDSQFGLEE